MDSEKKKKRESDNTTWKESPFLIIKGFLMGSADIVPGVSGGTMALITGIYDRLINAIKSVDASVIKNVFRFRLKEALDHVHWKFVLLLFFGLFMAVIFFTRVVPLQIYMFTHPEIVYGLFFGLIVGSVFLIIAEIKPENRHWKNIFPLLAGSLFGFWIVTLVPADTPDSFLVIFLSGAVSICAMILPGISGAYILLILRKYDYILTQLGSLTDVGAFDAFINLIPFGLGAVIGLALFSRLLSMLLKKYNTITLLVLVGFLVGSLYVIWPYQDREFQKTVRSERILPYNHPMVQEILDREEEVPLLPRYNRIGKILNEDATFDGLKSAEVETVSLKLISSTPFIPDSDDDNDVDILGGVSGMGMGLLMIIFISYLRKT